MGFFSPTFCIFGQKFSDKKIFRQFSGSQNIGGGAIATLPPPAMHDATELT